MYIQDRASPVQVRYVSTLNWLKVDTVSTFNLLKVETVSNFKLSMIGMQWSISSSTSSSTSTSNNVKCLKVQHNFVTLFRWMLLEGNPIIL